MSKASTFATVQPYAHTDDPLRDILSIRDRVLAGETIDYTGADVTLMEFRVCGLTVAQFLDRDTGEWDSSERLVRAAFALGTETGARAVAASEPPTLGLIIRLIERMIQGPMAQESLGTLLTAVHVQLSRCRDALEQT
jgi:hypothetical protein